MSTYCNPLDLGYKYQHFIIGGKRSANREAADPTMVFFKGKYYLFASMSAGFWYSDDLLNWHYQENRGLLIYDYAPDVRQAGDYLYFCASRRGVNCPFLRTKDPLSGVFEKVSEPFDFWDPDLFVDEDGRMYFYWGCSNMDPIWGVEMNPETLTPLSEPKALLEGRETELGFERAGENGIVRREGGIFEFIKRMTDPATGEVRLPEDMPAVAGFSRDTLQRMISAAGRPYIEGAFMTKHDGKYYLQYAASGTQFNTYCDGVYVSDRPLGPFTLQASNPFSSKPGGFIQGAGHGSTIEDEFGNLWHASTMRISVNHNFERRIGLWPAGFDADGELFCNQYFGDYPIRIPRGKFDPWSIRPEWMLLSYGKPVTVSSGIHGDWAVNENIRDWWSAADSRPGEWLCVDLEKGSDVRAVQVNLADEGIEEAYDESLYSGRADELRFIEDKPQICCYTVEASMDGNHWSVVADVARECANGYTEIPEGIQARYIRVTGEKMPYGQPLRISGLRVFGNGGGNPPQQADACAERTGDMDGVVRWKHIPEAQGVNIRYGTHPDKLYHSWLAYGIDELRLSTLMKGKTYWLRVDSFNENGITEGSLIRMES